MPSDIAPRPLPPPWGSHALPAEESLELEIGPLVLRARLRNHEIWLAHHPGDRVRPREETPPEPDEGAEEWVRWPVPPEASSIHLSPVLPPRPLVAQPELSFRLLSRAEARVYVRVPVWVRIEIDLGPERRRLAEVPAVVLSDTWWGGFADGELCYWLPTTARRRIDAAVFAPHLVVCPLQLLNGSAEELEVDRIALQVAHLTIFEDRGRLWADETRIRYRGDEEGSEIRMSGLAPAEAPDAVRIVAPRVPLPTGFRARAFARLRALRALGLHG